MLLKNACNAKERPLRSVRTEGILYEVGERNDKSAKATCIQEFLSRLCPFVCFTAYKNHIGVFFVNKKSENSSLGHECIRSLEYHNIDTLGYSLSLCILLLLHGGRGGHAFLCFAIIHTLLVHYVQ